MTQGKIIDIDILEYLQFIIHKGIIPSDVTLNKAVAEIESLRAKLASQSQPTPSHSVDEKAKAIKAMTETAKEASARAIADHNQIVKINSALYEITKLNSRTTNYAVARKIACKALGIEDAAMKESNQCQR